MIARIRADEAPRSAAPPERGLQQKLPSHCESGRERSTSGMDGTAVGRGERWAVVGEAVAVGSALDGGSALSGGLFQNAPCDQSCQEVSMFHS